MQSYVNADNETIEQITEKYTLRTYGSKDAELTEYDKKLVRSIKKLREGYASELAKRKCAIFLKVRPITSLFQAKKEEQERKQKQKIEVKADVLICSATKLDGHQCTAKAKPGEKFCGRHLKK